MRRPILLAALALLPMASGCVVRTAAHVATLPVRVGAKAVDWTTTSRDEADRNYGRKVRKQREREAKEQRKEAREARKAAAARSPEADDAPYP